MNHGSLFSGIGGFDIASEWIGWENIFHCEIEPFPRKILNYYWPNSKSYEDIKETDFTIHRGQINILTGGFPCQPYSTAGKRKGKEDDRHLWPEMLRAIREIQPSWIVGENVPGIISWNGGLVFEEVCSDLEAEGYSVQPVILPAVSKNAPHRRDRVWFIANSKSSRDSRTSKSTGKKAGGSDGDETKQFEQRSKVRATIHPSSERCNNRGNNREERQIQDVEIGGIEENKSKRNRRIDRAWENGSDEYIADTSGKRLERQNRTQKSIRFTQGAWDNFPTQSPICGGNDGLPTELDGITFPKWRNESIKGYGNAIVPQVAFEIFKVIETLNNKKLNK